MTCNRQACDIDNLEQRLEALLALAHESIQYGTCFNPQRVIDLLDPQHDATHNGTEAAELRHDMSDAAVAAQEAAARTYMANVDSGQPFAIGGAA